MKAIVVTHYGTPDDLRVQEVPEPVPRDHEVLVQVGASSVTFSNLTLVTGKPLVARFAGLGFMRPKTPIPGSDIAGRVVATGKNVTRFSPGDEVYGDLSVCGRGGLAGYVCAPEDALAIKPSNLTFAEAAAVPEAALVAMQALRDHGQIKSGQKVLITGASGGIGTFAVQIAKYFGAEVTGVCSMRNADMVRSLGADHIIDYTREDFTKNGQQYDLILATAGYRSIFDYRRALGPRGIYIATGGAMAQVFQALLLGPLLSMTGKKKMGCMLVEPNKDLDLMRELIEAGHVKPVIDRCYPLRQTAEAFRYYGEGHARGKVVITVEHDD
jgi:NADPH:quinone reductase-like Zn-dependent oxidoreductase